MSAEKESNKVRYSSLTTGEISISTAAPEGFFDDNWFHRALINQGNLLNSSMSEEEMLQILMQGLALAYSEAHKKDSKHISSTMRYAVIIRGSNPMNITFQDEIELIEGVKQ